MFWKTDVWRIVPGWGRGGGGGKKDSFYQDNYIVCDGGLTWFIEGYRSFEVSLTD